MDRVRFAGRPDRHRIAMPSDPRESLKKTLIANYRDLLARLTRKTGSRELAEDALQDTWLKVERAGNLDKIRNERAFLLRIAVNLVRNRLKSDQHHVYSDAPPDEADTSPDPERTALARADLSFLIESMKDMPARRQEIFLMAFYDEKTPDEIARHLGITARLVYMEMAKARAHCAVTLMTANKSEKAFHESDGPNVLRMKPPRGRENRD